MDIRAFIKYVMGLKGTTRTGWNLQFPVDSSLCSRQVDGAESVAAQEKRQLEDETMREICATLGSDGDEYYQLWQEFLGQTSPEGIIIAQLDLLEVAFQAVQYWRDGHTLNPREFFANVRPGLEHPEIIAQFVALDDELSRLEAQRTG